MVELVMFCFTTVCYNILANGAEVEIFIPSRGLCQADFLSLNSLSCLQKVCSSFMSKRVLVVSMIVRWRGGFLFVSHLFFVDNNFLFFKATKDEANVFKTYLKKYEEASG